jgi:hypothetical protein
MKTDLTKKALTLLFLLGVAFYSGGCSTVMRRPFPDVSDNIQIGVSNQHAPEEDWAPGAYSLGKTNVCFAKTEGQNDADTAQAVFGLIGRAIAVGDMAGEIKKMIQGEEDIYSLDLTTITQESLQKELKKNEDNTRFSIGDTWKKSPLQITPYAVFSFVDDAKARLWLVLRVEWWDLTLLTKKWSCRYLVGLGDPRPLAGDDSWASDNGTILQTTIKNDTQLALQIMFDDLNGKLRTGKEPKEPEDGLWANWAFYKKAYWADIQRLKTDKDWDIVLPLVDDQEFFAGVNVIPKNFALPAPPEKKQGGWGD